jgi:hypothetical protein
MPSAKNDGVVSDATDGERLIDLINCSTQSVRRQSHRFAICVGGCCLTYRALEGGRFTSVL